MHPARCLLLLLLAVAIIGATADDNPVFMNLTCSAAGNYTDSSPFGKNVAELLSALSTPPPATVDNYWWFRSHTVGAAPDQVYGLAVCYADADPERCLDCINSANSTSWYPDRCDHSRNLGFLRSVGCAIRYADAPFFGSADSGAGGRLILRSVVQASASMREARQGLLSQLAERAGGDSLRFATGSQRYKDADDDMDGAWQVMYGMAQCTRDLPLSECSSCLIDLLAVMYGDVDVTNSTSAQVMGLSCYLMYQMDKPINFIAGMVAPPAAAPPDEPPTGSAAASSPAPRVGLKTTVIAALAAAAVTLFGVGA